MKLKNLEIIYSAQHLTSVRTPNRQINVQILILLLLHNIKVIKYLVNLMATSSYTFTITDGVKKLGYHTPS